MRRTWDDNTYVRIFHMYVKHELKKSGKNEVLKYLKNQRHTYVKHERSRTRAIQDKKKISFQSMLVRILRRSRRAVEATVKRREVTYVRIMSRMWVGPKVRKKGNSSTWEASDEKQKLLDGSDINFTYVSKKWRKWTGHLLWSTYVKYHVTYVCWNSIKDTYVRFITRTWEWSDSA